MATSKRLSTRALQLNLDGLFGVFGGRGDPPPRIWNIPKGITTPAEFQLVSQQVKTLQVLVDHVQAAARQLERTTSKLAK
jgi:hypothetical protein